MMAELRENAPRYSSLPQIKNNQILFDFRNGKAGIFWDQIIALSSSLINLLKTKDRKGSIYLYYGPWLKGE